MRAPTGPAPVTSTRSSGVAPERLTVWIAIAVGSVRAARGVPTGPRAHGGGGSPGPVGTGRKPRPRTRNRVGADRGRRRAALSSRPCRSRKRGRCRRRPPCPALEQTSGHFAHEGAGPLVSEHVAGLGVALENEMEVGPADAAVGDLDEDLVRARERGRAAPEPRSCRRPCRPLPASCVGVICVACLIARRRRTR